MFGKLQKDIEDAYRNKENKEYYYLSKGDLYNEIVNDERFNSKINNKELWIIHKNELYNNMYNFIPKIEEKNKGWRKTELTTIEKITLDCDEEKIYNFVYGQKNLETRKE